MSDPQTSGGLLVACKAEAAAEVLALFHSQGGDQAAVIGRLAAAEAGRAALRFV